MPHLCLAHRSRRINPLPAVPLEGLVAELALEHVLGLVAPHVDLQVALVAIGARAHVAHVQVLLLHAMECKLLDRVDFVAALTLRLLQFLE